MPFTEQQTNAFILNNQDELMPLWQEFIGAVNTFTDYDSILHMLKCGYIAQDKIKDLYRQDTNHHISPDDMGTIIEQLLTFLSIYQFSDPNYVIIHEVMWDIWDNGSGYAMALGHEPDSRLNKHFCDRIALFIPLLMSLIAAQVGERPVLDAPDVIPLNFEAFFIFIIRSLKSKYPNDEGLNPHYHVRFFKKTYKLPVRKETIRKLQIELMRRFIMNRRREYAQQNVVDRLLLTM